MSKNYYENEVEDKKAINLINDSECETIDDLAEIFEAKNIPLRERYLFFFIGKRHQINPIDKLKWGTDKCKYKISFHHYNWWEKYLNYEMPMKIKLIQEQFPELSKSTYLENLKHISNIHVHSAFIRKGYQYLKMIEKNFEEMCLFEPNEIHNLKYPTALEIYAELDDISNKYVG